MASLVSEVPQSTADPRAGADFLPLKGTDHIEFFVGNARQAAFFYRAAFGMRLVAYRGPETGCRESASYVVEQGKIRFVLTTALRSESPIAEHVHRHGDGVHAIALWVDDARAAWRETTSRGARSVAEPHELRDDNGTAVVASIAAYGETLHTFVERGAYRGAFLPGYVAMPEDNAARPVGLLHVDHIVGNVGWNAMNEWVDFYARVMGFSLYQHFDDNDISTEYSALMSKVMANGNGYVKFPINEPAEGRRKSQIEEYLEFYGGPGVQHRVRVEEDPVLAGGVEGQDDTRVALDVAKLPVVTHVPADHVVARQANPDHAHLRAAVGVDRGQVRQRARRDQVLKLAGQVHWFAPNRAGRPAIRAWSRR